MYRVCHASFPNVVFVTLTQLYAFSCKFTLLHNQTANERVVNMELLTTASAYCSDNPRRGR